jgi:hypothetical protein
MNAKVTELINALGQLPPEEEQRLASEWLDELKWQLTQEDSTNFLQALEAEIENEITLGRVVDLEEVIHEPEA